LVVVGWLPGGIIKFLSCHIMSHILFGAHWGVVSLVVDDTTLAKFQPLCTGLTKVPLLGLIKLGTFLGC
jgi:hypothetical protein